MLPKKTGSAILIGATLLSILGCKSNDRFDTGPGGAYCGNLIGENFASDGLMPEGSTTLLKLSLTLDTHNLTKVPGILTSSDDQGGLCPGQRLFDRASVRTIQPALHDVIASVQLTPDHDQDIFAWVDSSCQGTFVSIVSLMEDGTVELRLFNPKPEPQLDAGAPANSRPGYGVFSLRKSESGCGY